MKCPHCNHEHPEGTKFCPFEGKEIQPQLKSCPNPDCVNFGKNILPNNYKYCPQCNTLLPEGKSERAKGVTNKVTDDTPAPEKKYKVILLSANESIFPEIDRIAGTDIVGHSKIWWLISRNKDGMFPYTLFEERVVESKARPLKEKLEALGAKVELQRLDSSTVADFRKGRIFAKNIELGKTRLRELLTKKYRKTYEENLDDWMGEDIVNLNFEAGEGVTANVCYVNPKLDRGTVAEIQSEYQDLFINPNQANFTSEENRQQIVNSIETSFDAMPCFAEMGIDDELFYINDGNDDRPKDEVEARITEILVSNNWERIPNFLSQENMFGEGKIQATFKYSAQEASGNTVFMMLFARRRKSCDSWNKCDIVFAINLIK